MMTLNALWLKQLSFYSAAVWYLLDAASVTSSTYNIQERSF